MGTTAESSGSVNIGRDVDDEYDDLILNVKHQTQGCSTEITDFRIGTRYLLYVFKSNKTEK